MSIVTGKRKLDDESKTDLRLFLLLSIKKKSFGEYYLEGQTVHSGTHPLSDRLGATFPLASWEAWKDLWESLGLTLLGVQFAYGGPHFQAQAKQFDLEEPNLKALLAYLSSRVNHFSVLLDHRDAFYSDPSAAVCGPLNKYLTILKDLSVLDVKLSLYDVIWPLMNRFNIQPLSTWMCEIYYGLCGRSYISNEIELDGAFHDLVRLQWKQVNYSLLHGSDSPRYTLLPNCTSYFLPRPEFLTPVLRPKLRGPSSTRYIDLLSKFQGVRELYLSCSSPFLDPATIRPKLYQTKTLEVYDGPLTFDHLILMIRSNPRLTRVVWRGWKKLPRRHSQSKELEEEFNRHPSLRKLCYMQEEERVLARPTNKEVALLPPDTEQKKAETLCIRDEGWCRLALSIAFLRANRDSPLRNSILSLALAPPISLQDEIEPSLPLTSPKHINLDKCLNTAFARAEIQKE